MKLYTFNEYTSLNEGFNDKVKEATRLTKKLLKAVRAEGQETLDMLQIFARELRHRLHLDSREDEPTDEEIRSALEQLKQVPKFAPYAIILLVSPIPFGSLFYTLFALKLNKLTNGKINILPKTFRRVFTESVRFSP